MLAFLQPLGAIIGIVGIIWALWDRTNEFCLVLLSLSIVLLGIGEVMK